MKLPTYTLILSALLVGAPVASKTVDQRKLDTFEQYDQDGDGFLSYDEYSLYGQDHGWSDPQTSSWFDRTDADGDQMVTFEEFDSAVVWA